MGRNRYKLKKNITKKKMRTKRNTRRKRTKTHKRRKHGGDLDEISISSISPNVNSMERTQIRDFDDISEDELRQDIEESLPNLDLSNISYETEPGENLSINYSIEDSNLDSSTLNEGHTDIENQDSDMLNITPFQQNESIPFSPNISVIEPNGDNNTTEIELDGGRRKLRRKNKTHKHKKRRYRKITRSKRT